jgi:hypothetical protein
MLFALFDYLQFARKKGRYGAEQRSNMAIAFEGCPPAEAVEQMLPGDIFLTQRLDDWFSWAMMYFSSSSVDHCGIYVGGGEVMHMTFRGGKKHRLDYVAEGARFLVVRPDLRSFKRVDEKERKNAEEPEEPGETGKRRFYHRFPPRLQLTWGAVEIVLGFYPERFRWKFVVDLVILAAVLDALTFWWSRFPFSLAIAAIIVLIAGSNQVRWWIWRWRKRPPPEPMSHPDHMLRIFFSSGGLMLTRLGPILVGDFGLLPLAAAMKLAEDDGSGEFKEVREVFQQMLESLGVLETTGDLSDEPGTTGD